MNTCNRIYPTQLSSNEVSLLKEKLIDPINQYWPISSIAFQSLRDGSLPLSLNTWYKYSKRLGITRPRPGDRREKESTGNPSWTSQPNLACGYHRFISADNIVHYIYLVVDNLSRKILSWQVAGKVNALIRRETIGEALKEMEVADEHILLITDGGPENSLKEFFEAIEVEIVHKKALIDVQCSNSLIEAHNKVIKYNYLYRLSVTDVDHLKKLITWIVKDYNSRPHISLDGMTIWESNSRFEFINNT